MKGGWVPVHRAYYNNPVFKNNDPLWGLFSKLLMEASFEPVTIFIHGENKIFPVGTLVTSCEELAKGWGISRQAMQKRLGCLRGCHLITMDSCQRFTVITIVGYGLQEENNLPVVTPVAPLVVTPVVTEVVTLQPPRPIFDAFQGSNKKEDKEKEETITTMLSDEDQKAMIFEQKALDKAMEIPYKEIVDHLNECTGKNYRLCEDTKRKIKARFNDGFKLEDFKKVHITKTKTWTGTEWEKYLRPDTLYGGKFQGYLNEKESTTPKASIAEPPKKFTREQIEEARRKRLEEEEKKLLTGVSEDEQPF